MTSKIRVLDEHTINKIAAGEVIENPASVVKELVENSLDAGASDICVEIKGGGRQLIRITDDGCGMNRDDALLCLERHATSKIKSIDDIYDISTMGFRGEAVPSIAAISKFTLITCSDNDPKNGTLVLVEGGKIMQCASAARSKGTTIEVKSLFFNIPVRKKFQKSPAYDANEIMKVLSSISLGYPCIKFQLISDQKTMLSTHISEGNRTFQECLGDRIQEILGKDFFEMTCFVEGEKGEYSLKGFVGQPSYTRQNRTGQYLFINQRAVVSPLISYAVREGFGTMLSTNRHPVFVLHITMPKGLVDVNVHPQKREVRLRQEQMLKEMIVEAISKSLQKNKIDFFIPNDSAGIDLRPFSTGLEGISFNFAQKDEPVQNESVIPIEKREKIQHYAPYLEPKPIENKITPQFLPDRTFSKRPLVLATVKHYLIAEASSIQENKDGVCLIDQKAAQSRIFYEKLLRNNQQEIAIQSLLIPYSFSVTASEANCLLGYTESLNSLGISLHQTGPNSFSVDAIPEIFDASDLHRLIGEILQTLFEQHENNIVKNEREKFLARTASRAGSSANKLLSLGEAQNFAAELMKCDMPFQCPLGKPTVAFLTADELAKKFN